MINSYFAMPHEQVESQTIKNKRHPTLKFFYSPFYSSIHSFIIYTNNTLCQKQKVMLEFLLHGIWCSHEKIRQFLKSYQYATDPERIYRYKIWGFKMKYLLELLRIKENPLEEAEFSQSVIDRKEMMEGMAFRQHLQEHKRCTTFVIQFY